jgi:sugar phosphate isomerase/epimerase
MKRRLSIGSWAYIFNQEEPTKDFHLIVQKLSQLGYDGVELGGFNPHPGPDTWATRSARQRLRKMVHDHGLEFSGLAADLWSQKLISVEDSGPYIAAFAKNLLFAEDLGITTIRVDTVEPITIMKERKLDPKRVFDRVVRAFDLCSKLAANRGINISWEFEPGFPINKPSEIIGLVNEMRDLHNRNFGVLFDSCHAYMCAVVGANQIGEKETLLGGEIELLQKLRGKITHIHLIDSDGTLNEHNTSSHVPFGQGKLDFDKLIPELMQCWARDNWWCVDLCFRPHAWDLTADCKRFLDRMRQTYAA